MADDPTNNASAPATQPLETENTSVSFPRTDASSDSPIVENPSPSLLLNKLPLDLVSHCLFHLPDTKSLNAAMLTSKAFNTACKDYKVAITANIIFSKMHESVYQEAAIAYKMNEAMWTGWRAGVDNIEKVFASERSFKARGMTLEKVKSIFNVHKDVEWFADRLTSDIMENHHMLTVTNAFLLTPKVMDRFKRSMYRLIMYIDISEKLIANMCHENQGEDRAATDEEKEMAPCCTSLADFEIHMIRKAFFSNYSTAEVEQMINICEMLIADVAPTLNQFIKDDIRLGAMCPNYISTVDQGMPMISEGLSFLRAFITAPTYSRRWDLMNRLSNDDLHAFETQRARFPHTDVRLISDIRDKEISVEEWRAQSTLMWLYREPFYDDGDIGPRSAWREFGPKGGLFSGLQWPTDLFARPWAYVFWDLSMLERASIMRIDTDGETDILDDIAENNPIFREYRPFPEWNSTVVANYVLPGYKVKTLLLGWGRRGWFDFDSFPPDGMPTEVVSPADGQISNMQQLDPLGTEGLASWYAAKHPEDIFYDPRELAARPDQEFR